MTKEEIIYKDQTFIKFTQGDYVSYWCTSGFKVKERFEFENPNTNEYGRGLERVIEIVEAEMPNGEMSYGMNVDFLLEKYGWPYPGMMDSNLNNRSYFDYKQYFFKDLLKRNRLKDVELKNVYDFLVKETSVQQTLF
ncbi:Uncharacterised protein [Algoriella xinjiangensis]|uniref:hypothetical protein n=1 Tax=Algoriella xinjiangensis TaxID=684065 RepID=UPI000F630134|nr:hypothetical protein [Algoriella xinjiangensis]VDH16731.1 Uncharacterised protein [Algoriella xinjiangensis]